MGFFHKCGRAQIGYPNLDRPQAFPAQARAMSSDLITGRIGPLLCSHAYTCFRQIWVTCNLSQLAADIWFPVAIGPHIGTFMRAQSFGARRGSDWIQNSREDQSRVREIDKVADRGRADVNSRGEVTFVLDSRRPSSMLGEQNTNPEGAVWCPWSTRPKTNSMR